jgi:glyoxylase-like metal-dependent hydrolase (beta-lactamase superfamily II)
MEGNAKIHVVCPARYLQCASYLIEGPDGLIVVDPGCGGYQDDLLTNIEAAGRSPDELRLVLLTHCHLDHARGAYLFRERGVPVVCSVETAEIMRTGDERMWYEFPDYLVPTEADGVLEDGEEIGLCGVPVRAMETPGHTPGSLSFLVETEDGLAALTGDLINIEGHPGWAGSIGFSVEDTLASIRRLIEAAPAKAFWGHGLIQEDAVAWLRSALALGESDKWRLETERHPDRPPLDSFEKTS